MDFPPLACKLLGNLQALPVPVACPQEGVTEVYYVLIIHVGQSKNKGSEQLAHILALEKTVQEYKNHVEQLEEDLINDDVNDIIDYDLQLTSAKGSLSKATQALKQKKGALGSHVESSIKQREPAISKLVTTYNTLCDELLGIRLMLEVDHCNEEERLSREQSILQEWFALEWCLVQVALGKVAHKDRLIALYVRWEAMVQHIPCAWVPSRTWGPTAEDIASCLATTQNSSALPLQEHLTHETLQDYVSEDGDIVSEDDDDLLKVIEEMALAEEYHIGQVNEERLTDDEDYFEGIGDGYLPSSPLRSPSKRHRK
ncbi:hypothetical protein F5141DRAFT_1060592 [Pisolithus sp. B1]|nr:hypothetical protein F5141DRAFT_1060592 [Pisolithus sp. B1]